MDDILLPEPYISAGYTGHIPSMNQHYGRNVGKLTHMLFINPCTMHSPDLIVTSPFRTPKCESNPTKDDITLIKRREDHVDAVYRHPMICGYSGYIPKMSTKFGERFIAAATMGVVQHQAEMDRLRCENDALLHMDLLRSGRGKFETSVGERLAPLTHHQGPLIPVTRRAQPIKDVGCKVKEDKLRYSKFTSPHFLDYEDKDKFIITGYDGHIPLMQKRYGGCHKKLTTDALGEFLKRSRNHNRQKWCPLQEAEYICPPDKYGTDIRDCPPDCDYTIYRCDSGMIPLYGGHVPGTLHKFGRVFGKTTYNAKEYLERHRHPSEDVDEWACHCLKIENPYKPVCP